MRIIQPQATDAKHERGAASAWLGRIAASLIVFLVFVILGPPIGGLIFAPILLIDMARGPDPFSFGPDGVVGTTMLALGFAYLAGGLQAAFVGVVAALAQLWRTSARTQLLPIVVASLITGVGYLVVTTTKTQPVPPVYVMLIFLGVHVGAGLGCWLIANAALWPLRRRSLAGPS